MKPSAKAFDIHLIQVPAPRCKCRGGSPQPPKKQFVFVLKDELERQGGLISYMRKISLREIDPEPLVIRANAGDCVHLSLTDLTGLCKLPNCDKLPDRGNLSALDPSEQCEPPTRVTERSFTSQETGIFPLAHLFSDDSAGDYSDETYSACGVLLIEEEYATFHDAQTGKILPFGCCAVIRRADGSSFREFILSVRDSRINYRSEPLKHRLEQSSAAYCYSSVIHGDPDTPLLETYPGEELVLHALHMDGNRQRSLRIAGISAESQIVHPLSPDLSHADKPPVAEILLVTKPYAPGDYLYHFGDASDQRAGLWGILRAHDRPVGHLKPLCADKPIAVPSHPDEHSVIHKCEGTVTNQNLIFLSSSVTRIEQPTGIDISFPLRANAGDWIEFTLHNHLDSSSERVSLTPKSLSFDPVYHSGINAGRNKWEQTVLPGGSRTYLWRTDHACNRLILQFIGLGGSATASGTNNT